MNNANKCTELQPGHKNAKTRWMNSQLNDAQILQVASCSTPKQTRSDDGQRPYFAAAKEYTTDLYNNQHTHTQPARLPILNSSQKSIMCQVSPKEWNQL
mmetsp:Transcript_106428/g.183514  ORF Transcript_106428/g.183514 Transcript_106428/m.183514 type:complete len:99 (-) Transcript_106428:47-343(-)